MRNAYEVRGDVTAIIAKRRDKSRYEILVDTADLPFVDGLTAGTWCLSMQGAGLYAMWNGHVGGVRKTIVLHRIMMQAPKGLVVDHINQNTLDNRRSNLRVVTPAENSANKRVSRKKQSCNVIGVYFNKIRNEWQASIMVEGRSIWLGYYVTLEDAAVVAIAARAYYHHGTREERLLQAALGRIISELRTTKEGDK